MYRFIFSTLLIIAASQQVIPQERDRGQQARWNRASSEQIQVERIAYFTERIGLTPEEAQLFWPIYNEMDKKRTALFDEKTSIFQAFSRNSANLTERQINDKLNRLAAISKLEGALHSDYDAKFRKVLSAQKVMNLYLAEMGFRNYLLQTMRERERER